MHLRAHCPIFENSISGGIDWESIERSSNLKALSAYLVLTDEKAEPCTAQNKIVQEVSEQFDVIVVFHQHSGDEKGLAVGDRLEDVRKQLFRALVGFSPGPDYEPVQYSSREILLNNRDKAVYRFSFSTAYQIGRTHCKDAAETWQEHESDNLPALDSIDINSDFFKERKTYKIGLNSGFL